MTITPAQYSKTQRRLLSTLGGLGVAALAAGTFVLSYDDLRLLALRGGAVRHRAFLYPGMIDGLVVVIILAILTARRSGWFSRTVRWLLLLVLIAGAGAAGVQRAVKGYAVLPDTPVNVGVAVAPWAILVIAVWLWVSMIKHMLSLRARRSRSLDGEAAIALPAAETVPGAVVDEPIIPGLGPGDTRRLPLAASVRELEPAREPLPEPPPAPLPPEAAEPEPNPWDAARIDNTPQPWERAETAYPEPSDPVPPSWLGEPDSPDYDDTQPLPTQASGTPVDEPAASPGEPSPEAEPPAEPEPSAAPEPLLPPARSRLDAATDDRPGDTAPEAPAAPAPEPPAEAAMTDKPPATDLDRPTRHLVAQTSLPTDVPLVGGPKPPLADTQPDGIRLPDTNPDGIPLVRRSRDDGADDEDDAYADERAEDPDAGEDVASTQWEDTEATPPSSKFRSGPMPPRG